MIVLKIISFILGVCFTLLGYYIFFKKKYSLINGFEEDFKLGRKHENYARRVGLIEIIVGIVCFIFCGVLILLV